MRTFSVEIPQNEKGMAAFQDFMNDLQDSTNNYIVELAKELNVSITCARDVYYLRTRSRHSEENEKELIRLHSIGAPPNVFDWP